MQRSASGSASDEATSMVTRVALIMNSFERADKLLRLDQVVASTGLPRSSAHRILTQLQKAGLLHHRTGGYCLAASALPATRMVDHSALRGVAAPVLERLHADTTLVVHLGVLFGAEVVYLDKVSGGSGVAVPTRVAGRTPAHASALGKAMLAALPAEDVDAIVGEPLRKCTPATIADLPTLHQELARIRSGTGSPTTTRSSPSACPASQPRSGWRTVRWRGSHSPARNRYTGCSDWRPFSRVPRGAYRSRSAVPALRHQAIMPTR